jgi:thiamine kinase-like enzyme
MIEGLDQILENTKEPGLAELRVALQELLGRGQKTGRFLGQQRLPSRMMRVHRLRFVIDGLERSLIVKHLKPQVARRVELVVNRWLPAGGFSDFGPPLLATVDGNDGLRVWHVYADLGQHELERLEPDRERVRAAVELIASIHTRFANHALLGEVRLHGTDFGIHYFESNVRDAIYALEALNRSTTDTPELPTHNPGRAVVSAAQASLGQLRDRLLDRLYTLREDLPRRAQALANWGGPETLLHGDLWTINVFVVPTDAGLHARLIDWDHAGVGPASYDLSTFLMRFPESERLWILDSYREAVAPAGWRLPDARDLNLMFETAELARFANRIIWPAIALVMDQAVWGAAELAMIDGWFEQFEPVLDVEAEATL